MTRLKWLLAFFILVWGRFSFATGNDVILRLPEKATVVGPAVSLGDVVDVIGENKALVERLRRITIGKAAPAGNKIKIDQGYIKVALLREGYTVKQFAFEGSAAVMVFTESQEFHPGNLLPEIKQFILEQTKESVENLDVKLSGEDKSVLLPAGNVQANFRPAFGGRYEGSIILTTELEVDGHLAHVLPLRLTVEVKHPAVVTTQRIEKDDKFTEENVAVVKEPTSKILTGCFKQLKQVLGRKAAMAMTSGTVLRVSDIFDPPVILHGQVVQAIVQRGNVELTVQTRAIEDGKAGDKIRVENTDTHKVLSARVLDENTVLVDQDKK